MHDEGGRGRRGGGGREKEEEEGKMDYKQIKDDVEERGEEEEGEE